MSERGGHVILTEKGREYTRILSTSSEDIDASTWADIYPAKENGNIGMPSSGLSGSLNNDWDETPDTNSSLGRLMIIDDDIDILLTYKLFLAESGFSVSTFSDPEEAIRIFKRDPRKIDLVLLDIRMESLNGLLVFRKLRSLNPELRVFFVTALDAAPEVTSILPGFNKNDIFAKPVDLDKVARDVRAAIVQERKKKSNMDEGFVHKTMHSN